MHCNLLRDPDSWGFLRDLDRQFAKNAQQDRLFWDRYEVQRAISI